MDTYQPGKPTPTFHAKDIRPHTLLRPHAIYFESGPTWALLRTCFYRSATRFASVHHCTRAMSTAESLAAEVTQQTTLVNELRFKTQTRPPLTLPKRNSRTQEDARCNRESKGELGGCWDKRQQRWEEKGSAVAQDCRGESGRLGVGDRFEIDLSLSSFVHFFPGYAGLWARRDVLSGAHRADCQGCLHVVWWELFGYACIRAQGRTDGQVWRGLKAHL